MDIKAYLRDLDREEEELRREIMRAQVRIQQLNDTRVLLMQREEERARRLGQASPFGTVYGAEIAVKDPTLMLAASEAGKLSIAAKTGTLPALADEDGKKTPLSLQVLRVLAETGAAMYPADLHDALPDYKLKRFHGTLHSLKTRKQVTQDADRRYVITAQGRKVVERRVSPRAVRSDAGIVRGPRPPRREGANEEVLGVIRAAPKPLVSGDIITALLGEHAPGQISKKDRDRIYAVIFGLHRSGRITRDESGRYHMPRQEEAAA